MAAPAHDVARELQELGLDAEVVNAHREGPTGVNVWDPEAPTRNPVLTAWEPKAEDQAGGWSWGDTFQYGAHADDDAQSVAAKVSRTISEIQRNEQRG